MSPSLQALIGIAIATFYYSQSVVVHGCWVAPSVHRIDAKDRTMVSNQERRVNFKSSIRPISSYSWQPLLAVSDPREDKLPQEVVGLRLNKVFKATHSRRAADALILSGGVTVNGVPVSSQGGFKVIPFVDEVALDGTVVQGWEAMNGLEDPNKQQTSSRNEGVVAGTEAFEYVKYWKPRGVTCTTDRAMPDNIIDQIINDGYSPRHRVYPVGRLDKDTSGLIVLTSDGRLPNSALRGKYKQPKVYEVHVDQPIWDEDINHLRNGVMITTVAQRDGTSMQRRKSLTARTRPCEVERLSQATIRITLVEGRNRQIRKMLGALDYAVLNLKRVSFLGLALEPLKGPGSWLPLAEHEMHLIEDVLRNAENDTENKQENDDIALDNE